MLSLRVPLVLASASPRRRDLLAHIGIRAEIRPSGADETWPGGDEGAAVETLARRKAAVVTVPGSLVLAADTVVVLDGDVLGKPATPAEARAMLHLLSGRTHTVYTGFALTFDHRTASDHRATRVTFADLTDAEIAAYVASGSPMDRAGAYGIQDDAGALFVTRIDGDYPTVVGLPLRAFYESLAAHFPDLLAPPASPLP
ncbi:MAG TPA: Maf family protein [Rubricoccaceae bacterium]